MQADLSVTKQCEPADLVPGDDVTCTVSIRNAGPLAATDIVAVDTVPDGLDLAGRADRSTASPATATPSP